MIKLRSLAVALLPSICLSTTFASSTVETQAWPPNKGDTGYILRYDSIDHPVEAQRAMVVSQNSLASQVGADILKAGGNAVDAAVATGFALAVTLPRAGNLGGGGFMLVHIAASNKTIAIDYRGAAPALAKRNFYLDQNGKKNRQLTKYGHTASTVPGTVAGLYEAHQRFGKLSWSQLLQPAIQLAQKGFSVSSDLAWALKAKALVMTANPSSCEIYFKQCSGYQQAGDTLIQQDLAKSLGLIAKHGRDGFYRGQLAAAIETDMLANGGLIRRSDLATYQARVLTPISSQYRQHQITSMPPPAGGLPLLQIMNIVENFDLASYGPGSAQTIHIMAEAMKRAYAYRWELLGDPAFNAIPVNQINDKRLAQKLATSIDRDRATPLKDITAWLPKPSVESPNTTHYSIIDAQGNAVSNTYTLSASFGSGVSIANTGILMNNQINNFYISAAGNDEEFASNPASIQAGKRTKSTQSPTMVFKDGKLMLITGTPGGGRIITTVAQLISNVIDHKMNIAEATQAPRFHHGWRKDELQHERGFSPDTLNQLKAMGYLLKPAATMGSTQSILIEGNAITAAADTRRPNAAAIGLN